jgi:hypothetical protein
MEVSGHLRDVVTYSLEMRRSHRAEGVWVASHPIIGTVSRALLTAAVSLYMEHEGYIL